MDERTNDQQATVEEPDARYTSVSNPRRVRL